MTIASQLGYDITDMNNRNKDVTHDPKRAKPIQALTAEQHEINDSKKYYG